MQAYSTMLPEEVTEKAARYHNPKDRLRNLAGEALSRYVIQQTTGRLPAGAFPCSEHGKPYLEKEDIFFNISHSGDYVAVAISSENIGVDIEKLRRNKMQVARRFFSEEEIHALQTTTTPDEDFTRLWSLKEAYLKYAGSGLTEALNSFTVRKGAGEAAYRVYTSRNMYEPVDLIHKQWQKTYFLSVCYSIHDSVKSIQQIDAEKLMEFARHYEE